MLKKLVILAITILIFIIVANAQSQRPFPGPGELSKPIQKQSSSKKQTPEKDQRGTKESPVIVKILDSPTSQEKTEQDRKDREGKAFYDRWLVYFTGALVFVVFLQFIWMVRQEKWMRRNVEIAQKAADAATDSAKVAETALHVAERPYLIIDKFELKPFGVGSYLNIIYEIHNVGHTPAQIMESLTIVDIVEKDFFKTPVYDAERGFIGPKQAFIQPNEKRSMIGIGKKPVTLDEFSSVKNDSKLIFAWGKIIIRDVFDKMWINGFGAVFSQIYGLTMMDGYNYTKEYEQDKEQS